MLLTSKYFDGTHIPLNDKKVISFPGCSINPSKSNNPAMGRDTTYYEVIVPGSTPITNSLSFDQSNGNLQSNVAGVTATANINDASISLRGLVNTTTQTFTGAKTFNGNVTVTGVLQNSGAIKRNVRNVTATSSLLATDDVLFIGTGATAMTLTLTTPVGNAGRQVTISRNVGSTGTLTIAPGAGQIEALAGTLGATTTLAASGAIGANVVFISDGTNWLRMING